MIFFFTIISYIAIFIFAILQIVLFFKIWAMTNNVEEIKNFLINRAIYNETNNQTNSIENITKNDDDISPSRKYTRLSDGKKLYVQYIVGDKYKCLDPDTKEIIGQYSLSEIKKGW